MLQQSSKINIEWGNVQITLFYILCFFIYISFISFVYLIYPLFFLHKEKYSAEKVDIAMTLATFSDSEIADAAVAKNYSP